MASLKAGTRAVSIRSRLLGPEHPATATVLSNLAQLYHHGFNDLAKAEAIFLEVLRVREQHYGSRHRLTLLTLNYIACIFRDQQKFDQAEAMLLHALKIAEEEHGRDAYVTCKTMRNIVFVRPVSDTGEVKDGGWASHEGRTAY